jgi:hypothetical protein
MSLIHGLGERIGDASANPHYGGLLDAELHGDRIGGLEAGATDITHQTMRVGAQNAEAVLCVVVVTRSTRPASTSCGEFSDEGFMATSAATRGACMLFAQAGASATTPVV